MNLSLLKQTYSGKKVFLTGHTGFKGSWFTLILSKFGAQVKGYALAPKTKGDLFFSAHVDQSCESVIADIRDREKLKKEILDFQPDFIFHMAAQALVIDSYHDPVYTYETNVMGTAYLLDAVKALENKCCVINITTDKVYENLERIEPYAENERLGGFDPYSNSKACSELVSASYRLSFFNPDKYQEHKKSISTVRSGNVIGGGDWSENRIIPDTVKALSANIPLKVRNPYAVRPWQHVLDPLHGYLITGAYMNQDPIKYATSYNFGPEPEDELNVEELVKVAIKTWGNGTYNINQSAEKLHEAGLLKLAIEKAKQELNWTPKYNSTQAIQKTISWYKLLEREAIDSTTNQIDEFFGFSDIRNK